MNHSTNIGWAKASQVFIGGPVGHPTSLDEEQQSFDLILRGDQLALRFDGAVLLPSLAVLVFFDNP